MRGVCGYVLKVWIGFCKGARGSGVLRSELMLACLETYE